MNAQITDLLRLLAIGLLCAVCMAYGAMLAIYNKVVIQTQVCPEGTLHVITAGKLRPCIGGYLRCVGQTSN